MAITTYLDLNAQRKFKAICSIEGISMATKTRMWVKDYIKKYEKENGSILVKNK